MTTLSPWKVRVWTKAKGVVFETSVPNHHLTEKDIAALGRALFLANSGWPLEDFVTAYRNRHAQQCYGKQITKPIRFTDLERSEQRYTFGNDEVCISISESLSEERIAGFRKIIIQNQSASAIQVARDPS